MPYRGLSKRSIDKYVEIAGKTSDTIVKNLTRESIYDPNIIAALGVVSESIKKQKSVVYGGTALNAVLPKKLQFYDPEYDLPDWDFFCAEPIKIALDIADRVKELTSEDTSVTTAAHEGTYKVFCSGEAIADITYVPEDVLTILRENSIVIDKIHYAGPNYLRMAAYIELSRPLGQPDRWEKVIRRISLLNIAYPIETTKRGEKPRGGGFLSVSKERKDLMKKLIKKQDTTTIRENGEGEVFAFIGPEVFSAIRSIVYKRNPSIKPSQNPSGIMIMSPNISKTTELITGLCKSPVIHKLSETGELLGEQVIIYSDKKEAGRELCTIIETRDSCQGVYTIRVKSDKQTQKIRIGSIESMLYIYSALTLSKHPLPIDDSQLLRAVDSLIRLHIKILIRQKKPLLPLTDECIGKQITIKDMRSEKKTRIKNIVTKRGKTNAEYFKLNLRYDGGDKNLRKIILRALEK